MLDNDGLGVIDVVTLRVGLTIPVVGVIVNVFLVNNTGVGVGEFCTVVLKGMMVITDGLLAGVGEGEVLEAARVGV